jgi:hypothetical protein
MTLLDLLILKLGARFTKLLIESWLGKDARTTIAGDVVDLLTGQFQSAADRKKAKREFEEVGDRMARELLPLFEDAEKRGHVNAEVVLAMESTLADLTTSDAKKRGHVNAEAVVLALESTLTDLTTSALLIKKDLDPGAILDELKQARPLPPAQYSQAETDLYDLALERSVRHVVEVASWLPKFEEAFAARSLQQLSRLTDDVDEILAGVRRIEATVGTKARDEKAREYEINYRLAVQRNLDYLEIFGIDLPPESRSQKLSVAYVSLNLESRSGEESESLPAEALFDRLSSYNGRLLIRGDAGMGKSTLFRWAGIGAAAQGRVPFLIRLRQCKEGSLPSPDDFPELVAASLGSPPVDWVRSVLKEQRALLLLDGVDEIPNAHREITRRGIADLVGQYPDAYYVISTRPRAVDPDWLGALRFHEARINPMSELDRGNFIDRWHEAVTEELKAHGKTAAELPDLAASLKKELGNNPEVARLATNPLLCAMICALHRDRRQKLPERQRQLCEDLCHALLHRRERESGLNLDDFPEPYRRLDYQQKRAAVQELAHHMVLNEYSSLSTEEAQEQIGRALKQFPGHSADDARVVTESLVERSGILREETPGELSFIHNAFKELLAGDYFAQDDAAGLLARRALDPSWQPVILFAVAADLRGFATKVISKILEPGSTVMAELRARQLMALRCRAAALYVDQELDLGLQKLTATLFPPRTMEDAEALAAGGNPGVPFLISSTKLRENEAAACVRALRLIGTPQARQALRSFLGDRRETVISELSQAVNPLEIDWVLKRVLAHQNLPEGIRAQISDLSPLSAFPNLQKLDLSRTQVADLSPLATLTSLEKLDLFRTQVADLSPLATLTDLEDLGLSWAPVADLSPLMGLAKLKRLYIRGTPAAKGDLGLLKHLECQIVR